MQVKDRLTNARRERLERGGSRGGMLLAALAAVGGALAAFLLDPQRGRARRARLIDQGAATIRRAGRQVARTARMAGMTASGKLSAATHAGEEATDLDDATLAAKIETELFRDPSIPKGSINVNVERGIAVLRGEVPTADMRDRLASAAERVPGVWSVRNMLHLPGEPAGEELMPSGMSR